MPVVKIKHIVSFSSEETPHKADNLLNEDSSRKWKCAAGEKQACIVFQLEKSTQLSSIDIANEGSAFIEVLVGRSSNDNVQYQVILVASSFMSPQESRQGSPPNRVRIFNKDKLTSDIASQKWDLVKVVCTQPFNKRSTYGLSFIKFHTTDDDIEQKEPEVPVKQKTNDGRKTFGSFKIKEETDDSQSIPPGMSMKMYQMAKKENLNTSMEQKRDINTVGQAKKEVERDSSSSRRRSGSPDRKEVEQKRRKVDQPRSTSNSAKATPIKFDALKQKTSNTPKATKTSSSNQVTSQSRTPANSRQKNTSQASTSKKRKKKPYNEILSGVVFVISGFQNPLRSELRDKALGMGAQYRRDWTQDSTHLICAFPNTPKYRQVSLSGGKIVRKEWINDCAGRKELVSWRNYNMGSDPSDSSSEDEGKDESVSNKIAQQDDSDDVKEEEDPYGVSTDEEAGDTEDEIEKVKARQKDPVKVENDANDEDPYNASTDEEPETNSHAENGLPELPDYFHDKTFMMYGKFASKTGRLTRRHIVACGGKITEYMNEDVEYIITEQPWDDNFDQALTENAGLVFVRPGWLFQCGAQQRIISYQPYAVTPS
ncbi:DNA repair protein XRCC1-like [Styela clava]